MSTEKKTTLEQENEQLQQYIASLEQQVEQLTRAPASPQQAQTIPFELLAAMSYEIRTPLNAILGITNLLHAREQQPEHYHFVETVRTSGHAILSIINDYLDFAKIEAGNLKLDHHPLDLHHCIEEAIDQLAATAAEKQIDLIYYIDPATPVQIMGDSIQIRRIAFHLISTGVKLTWQGGVMLSIHRRPAPAPTPEDSPPQPVQQASPPSAPVEIHFRMTHTGLTVAPEHLRDLFQPFNQLDAPVHRRYGIPGTGLAMGKRLAELMGGTMWVEQTEDGHSAFHCTIQAQALGTPTTSEPYHDNPALDSRRVLLVDDNPDMRFVLSHHVESWNMIPLIAESGPAALTLIEQGQVFDVALIGQHMPDMDGTTLAKEIRNRAQSNTQESLDWLATVPLVLLSYTSVEERQTHEATTDEAGTPLFAARLQKPFKPSLLYQSLSTTLAHQTPSPSTSTRTHSPQEPSPLRILLAEDDPLNRKIIHRILEHLGYRADLVSNGQEVLTALEHTTYDVILMDVQMPGMDGLTATRNIRSSIPNEHQPHIVAMTAHTLDEDREECMKAGMDTYIGKPIQMNELLDTLLKVSKSRVVQ